MARIDSIFEPVEKSGVSGFEAGHQLTNADIEAAAIEGAVQRLSAKLSGSYGGEESFKEGGVEYREGGKTE